MLKLKKTWRKAMLEQYEHKLGRVVGRMTLKSRLRAIDKLIKTGQAVIEH